MLIYRWHVFIGLYTVIGNVVTKQSYFFYLQKRKLDVTLVHTLFVISAVRPIQAAFNLPGYENCEFLHSLSFQILDEKPNFFPLLAAQTLGEEEDETAHHLEELKTMVKDMLDRFKAGVRMCLNRDQTQP